MKQAITVITLVFLMLGMKPADAVTPVPVPLVGSAIPITNTFIGGMVAAALLPVVIVELQDEKVWSHVFPVVDETYPLQHDVQRVAIRQAVYIKPQTNADVYPYMDENGMHYPAQIHRGGV